MNLPPILQGESLTRLLQGAAAGFAITVVLGFGWGGWQLQSKAQKQTKESVNSAVVAALAPICADKFQHAADAPATLVALKATDSWKQDTFVEKGGWATFPGAAEPNRNVAEACARILSDQK
jgi:alpha/beta superfamily hydrolase